jgi:hypothetical protein
MRSRLGVGRLRLVPVGLEGYHQEPEPTPPPNNSKPE